MNIEKIRSDFPLLLQKHNGKKIKYLDNAATTQKPKQVINAIKKYYEKYNANVHRGINFLSQKATEKFEDAHEKTAEFINAKNYKEIIFTNNTTEAMNTIAYSLGSMLKNGDEILLTKMEHHANIVPWQELAKRKKIKIRFANIKNGKLDMEDLKEKTNSKTKIISVTMASNILGTINPVEKISKIAKEQGAYFVVDAAQAAPHTKINVKKINADLLAFSGHKMLGPTGIGVLYGKSELLEKMPPFLTGGDMISTVTLKQSRWNKLPWKFEAGTPNIAGAIGFDAALDYLKKIKMENIEAHEQKLMNYAEKRIKEIKGIETYGPKGPKTGILPFNIKGIHAHDVAGILDEDAIAIRSGNHCAQPLMQEMNIESLARASFYIYNTIEEIDSMAIGIEKAKKIFGI